MANRYWVGGTDSWDGTAGTKWAATSGGTGGETVPTSVDDVFFDGNSGTGTVTIASGNAGAKTLNCTGFTGTLTGTSTLGMYGDVTLSSGMTYSHTGTVVFNATSTLITAGKTFSAITTAGSGTIFTLGDALNTGNRQVAVGGGTFNTAGYNITAGTFSSSTSAARTINLSSSTITLSGGTNSFNTNIATNLTFNAGTSTIIITANNFGLFNTGTTALTFYNVSFTNTSQTSGINFTAAHTFNNLSITGRASSGLITIPFSTGMTINGTLTVNSGNANATCRALLYSDTLGTSRTLTCNAVSFVDVDFRDITIAGAAAPASGTRLGDGLRNSGITFGAGKTVYYRGTGSANWYSNNWSATSGGSADATQFPLPQDTAVFPAATYPASGSTITLTADATYGTIDTSLRTTNTIILGGAPILIGDFIGGTGLTVSTGGANIQFTKGGAQSFTPGPNTYAGTNIEILLDSVVTLQGAYTSNRSGSGIVLTQGTFDANGYNVTCTNSGFSSSNSNTRTVAVGSGTWTLQGSGTVWNTATATNLTITGTGTISLTNAASKTFAGGSKAYTNITINQGGAGSLIFTGSNTFKDITNTYSATGATTITFTSGTSTTLSQFTATGAVGNVLTLGATTTSRATLRKPSAWQMGANSTDGGNNIGLSFTAGGGIDYLSVSYINGVDTSVVTDTGNFLGFFF